MDGLGVVLPTLRCDCGSDTIVAACPGTVGDRAGDLFALTRAVPLRAWCCGCWPALQSETPQQRKTCRDGLGRLSGGV